MAVQRRRRPARTTREDLAQVASLEAWEAAVLPGREAEEEGNGEGGGVGGVAASGGGSGGAAG